MSLKSRKEARRLKMHWDPKDGVMHYPIIQWFIANDNLGAFNYKGTLYNVMDRFDRSVLLARLITDGLVSVQSRVIYDTYGNESEIPGYFKVLHEDYLYIKCKQERFFWINLADRLLPQMTQEECDAYNVSRKEEENHVL